MHKFRSMFPMFYIYTHIYNTHTQTRMCTYIAYILCKLIHAYEDKRFIYILYRILCKTNEEHFKTNYHYSLFESKIIAIQQ